MVQRRNILMLLACLLVSVFAVAQTATTPVSTLPYLCDFEDAAEVQNWTLSVRTGLGANQPLPSHWTVGTGAKHSGFNGLYISQYNQATGAFDDRIAQYDGTKDLFTVAERRFMLQPGNYDLAFDWRCLGDTCYDAIYVYWVPATTTITNRTVSTLPTNATPLTINGKNYLSGSSSWQQARTSVSVVSAQEYKLYIAWRNNTTNTYNPGACIDNVQLQAKEQATDCWHTVTNMRWQQGDLTSKLSWNGPAGATYEIYYWLNGSTKVDTLHNVTGNSHTFNTRDLSSGVYTFAIRTNCGDDQSIFVELINCKSLGELMFEANACPTVDLMADLIDGTKYLTPSCDENGNFKVNRSMIAGGGSIAGYAVDQIPYSECPFPFDLDSARQYMGPGNYVRQISTDDVWDSQILNLPFKVCFFEGTYSQAVVCSNGIVSFDTQVLGKAAGYSLTAQPNIPSTTFGQAPGTGMYWRNAIYGVFQDYYPTPTAAAVTGAKNQIWYGVLGEWPCRKMVVCWNEVPMYANHTTVNSSMIVMYEGTNVIDVYVKKRDLSPSGWNNNIGIIGLQNAEGTDGVAAPGRNTKDKAWEAHKEAWRFMPYATPMFSLKWYRGAFTAPDSIDAYIHAHPEDNIELAIADSFSVAKEDGINAITVRLQYSQCNGDFIDISDYAYIVWATVDTVRVDTFTCGTPYLDEYVVRDYPLGIDSTGNYTVIVSNDRGCDSIYYDLKIKVLYPDTAYYDTLVVWGTPVEHRGELLVDSGMYEFHVPYEGYECDSLVEFVYLHSLCGPYTEEVVDKIVCSGGLPYRDPVLGEIHAAGTYLDTLRYSNGCDSVHYTLNLEVLEALSVKPRTTLCEACADEASITLGYDVLAGAADSVKVTFANDNPSSLASVTEAVVGTSGEVVIILPDAEAEYRHPGVYSGVMTFYDKAGCSDQEYHFELNILFPSSIIFQRWDDVLSVANAENNGGFTFDSYQWLKNGEELPEATKSYYYAADKLDLTAEYRVRVTKDGKIYHSCPFYAEAYFDGINVAPRSVRRSQQVEVTVPDHALVRFYSVSGQMVSEGAVEMGQTMMNVPSEPGLYVVQVSTDTDSRSFRVNVAH